MKWLKGVFKNQPKNDESLVNNENDNLKISFKIFSKIHYDRIDYDYIDLIYFDNKESKENYIIKVKDFLNNLGVNEKTEYNDLLTKIIENEYSDNCIDLMRFAIVFKYGFYTQTYKNDVFFSEEFKEKNLYDEGDRFNDLLASKSFIYINIQRKIDSNFLNFEFEDSIFEKYILPKLEYDYKYTDILTFLVEKHHFVNNLEKSEYYYKLLINIEIIEGINLSHSFKSLGEYFYSINDYKKTIELFEIGLKINPNLSVKRKLEISKNKINN
jgi:hypothetical protein